MRTWCSFYGRICNETQRKILAQLSDAGIQTYIPDPETWKGPGMLFFDEVSPALCNFFRELTANGIERAIAISTTNLPLHPSIWTLLKAGASDVVIWDDPERRARGIHQRLTRWRLVDDIVDSALVSSNLVGKSNIWVKILREVVEVARFSDAPVLITGETGTGKELAARLMHTLDPRTQKGELILLDCTTIVPSLAGSEFFGHERGAFTGAEVAREGAFSLADGGTLFLDEIGDLPLDIQSQLLRAIQEKAFKKVGGNSWKRTNFRLVCATNRDLEREVKEGRFRGDLYYRLAGWSCRLPPLRERQEDIVPLAQHFLQHLPGREIPSEIEPAVEHFLKMREYPGNVRDLRQLIHRMAYRHVGQGALTVGDIPQTDRPEPEELVPDWTSGAFEQAISSAVLLQAGLKEIGRRAEDLAIRAALREESGNLQRAAKRLGVTDRTLQLRRASWRSCTCVET